LLVSEPFCVLILGMHRSGTSSLAGCLQDRGLHLGEVSEKNPFNSKGNRENPWVMRLNNSVLLKSGGKWNNPPDKISWTEDLALERDDLVAFFKHSGARHWEFKDPRTLLTLPFWEEGISRIAFVGTFRHPMAGYFFPIAPRLKRKGSATFHLVFTISPQAARPLGRSMPYLLFRRLSRLDLTLKLLRRKFFRFPHQPTHCQPRAPRIPGLIVAFSKKIFEVHLPPWQSGVGHALKLVLQ